MGFVSQKRYEKFCKTKQILAETENVLKSVKNPMSKWTQILEMDFESKNSELKTYVILNTFRKTSNYCQKFQSIRNVINERVFSQTNCKTISKRIK